MKFQQRNIKDKLIIITSLSVFVIYFLLQFGLMYRSGFTTTVAAIDSLVNSLTVLFCCFVIFLTCNYYTPRISELWKVAIIGFIVASISIALSRWINCLLPDSTIPIKIFDNMIPYRMVVNFLILTSVAIFNIIWNIQEEHIINIKRKQESENLLREAELYNLRQQLQPHFLFNSLNSIIALISANPKEARNMTFKLSDFLRGTLRKENNQLITLEDELDHLQLYLDIEKVRFGHRLQTVISSNEDLLNTKVPAMITQPLVENAIKHGLYNVTNEVEIKINCFLMDDLLCIRVSNPFDIDDKQIVKAGTGFGLSSIQRRLYLLYGRNDLLETNIQDTVFISTLKIPQTL